MSKRRVWDFFDFLRGIKSAMGFEKLWWAFQGLFLAAFIFSVFSFAGTVIGFPGSDRLLWFQEIGLVLAGLVLFLYAGGIGRMLVFEERKDEVLFSSEVKDFVCKNLLGILAVPLGYIAIYYIIYGIGWVIGLPGAIPVVGPIYTGLLLFMYFIGGLVLVLIALMGVLACFVHSGIVGTSSGKGMFSMLLSSLPVVSRGLVKIAIYFIATLIITSIVYTIIWLFTMKALGEAGDVISNGRQATYSEYISGLSKNYYSIKKRPVPSYYEKLSDEEKVKYDTKVDAEPKEIDKKKSRADDVEDYLYEPLDFVARIPIVGDAFRMVVKGEEMKVERERLTPAFYVEPIIAKDKVDAIPAVAEKDGTPAQKYQPSKPAVKAKDGVWHKGGIQAGGGMNSVGGFLGMLTVCLIFAGALAYPFSLFFSLGAMTYLIARGEDDFEIEDEEAPAVENKEEAKTEEKEEKTEPENKEEKEENSENKEESDNNSDEEKKDD